MNCKIQCIYFFKVLILNTLILILCMNLNAQRGKHWFFGQNAAIQFSDSVTVTPLSNSAMTAFSGCVTMSDNNGNLLFYSNGYYVWNKNHQIMSGGTISQNSPPTTASTSFQNLISLPMPDNDSLYYLIKGSEFIAGGNGSTSNYRIINMNKNNGLGEVITPSDLSMNNLVGTGISAISHQNQKDFWIILTNKNILYAYLLSNLGIASTPIVSDFTNFLPSYSLFGFSSLISSPNGDFLFKGNFNSNTTPYIFKFDKITGEFSAPISLINNYMSNTGCFSPDSKKLYIYSSNRLLQYKLDNYTQVSINQNIDTILSNINPGGFGNTDLALGLNNKIYLSRYYYNKISCIANPNNNGSSCNFKDTAVLLPTGVSLLSLPNFYNSFNNKPLSISIERYDCNSYSFKFHSTLIGYTLKKWSLGDGFTSTDSIINHTYNPALADSFLVTFSIVKQGSTDTLRVEKWLRLNKKPLVNFNAITNGCIKDSVQFTSNITPLNNAPINTIVWSLGNGSFINQQSNFNYLYNDTGTYTIKLFAKDNLGCTSDTATTNIAVNKKAVAKFGIIAPYCNNVSVALKDSSIAYNSNTNLWKYYISNGDSIVNALTGNQFYNFTIAGNYTIKQIIKTSDGCLSDTINKTITIYPKPTAQFTTPQNCVLDKSIFTDNSIGNTITQWQWNFGDANASVLNPNTSTIQNGTHQYTQAANYAVQLIVTTNNNCSDTLTKNFTVNGAIPKAAITLAQQSFCSGDTSRFIDNSYVNFGNLIKLRWLFNGTDSVVVNNPIAGSIYLKKFTSFGTPATQQIPVQLKVQSGINCVNTLDTFIVLKAQPKVVFTPINAVCQNTNPFFITNATEINNALGVGKYTGAGLVNNVGLYNPKLVTSNNSYTILYEFTTALDCSDTASQQITILDTPYINAGNNKVILEGGQVQLNAIASGNSNLSFLWLPNIALNNNLILQPTAAPVDNITYTITATQSNNCSSSDSVQVQVLKSLIIPNAFSPNGDRVNDTWVIPYLESYPNAKLFVYSRNGQLVFESTGYTNAWDGTLNGKPLPVGSYYYFIQPGSGRKPYTGVVTILR